MKKFIKDNSRVFVFTSAVMVFMIGVSLTQLTIDNLSSSSETPVAKVEQGLNNDIKEEETVESFMSPVDNDVSITSKYYDPSLSDEELENALVYFEGVYRPNVGVSYTNEKNEFSVYASLSGVVTKKTDDPLLGWIITITSEQGIEITYQSLGKVNVEKDEEVSQGQLIGTSGQNVYQSDLGNHLHFVIEADSVTLNPEKVIGKSIDDLS